MAALLRMELSLDMPSPFMTARTTLSTKCKDGGRSFFGRWIPLDTLLKYMIMISRATEHGPEGRKAILCYIAGPTPHRQPQLCWTSTGRILQRRRNISGKHDEGTQTRTARCPAASLMHL
eukprot:924312-Pyramimonas_sp.AAC.1